MQSTKTFEEVERGNTRVSRSPKGNAKGVSNVKVDLALEVIEDCLKASANPVCLCSFGKDSLVMLHLILRIKKVPVIYWREPYFQSKFAHPQKIAEEWDLDVYDYPPTSTDYIKLGDYFDVFNYYYVNGKDWINLYTGTKNYDEGKPFLCAIEDLLLRPKVPAYDFKWDCIFHGHKQVDPLYIGDRVELPLVTVFGERLMTLPIKDWTDEDIWAYIKEHDLPYNKERYDDKNEARNNDLFPTCHNCLASAGKDAYCPKAKSNIPCVGRSEEDSKKLKDSMLGAMYR